MNIIVTVTAHGINKLVVNKSGKIEENITDSFVVKDRDELRTRLQAFVNSFSVKAANLKEKVKLDNAFAAMIERACHNETTPLSVFVHDNLYTYRVFDTKG